MLTEPSEGMGPEDGARRTQLTHEDNLDSLEDIPGSLESPLFLVASAMQLKQFELDCQVLLWVLAEVVD